MEKIEGPSTILGQPAFDELELLERQLAQINAVNPLTDNQKTFLDIIESYLDKLENESCDKEIAIFIDDCCELIGVAPTTERTIDLYFEALEAIPPHLMVLARARLLQTFKYRLLPLPGDVYDIIKPELDQLKQVRAKIKIIWLMDKTRCLQKEALHKQDPDREINSEMVAAVKGELEKITQNTRMNLIPKGKT
jgi:hypothetical protein